MQLLKKHKSPFLKTHIYLIAFAFIFVVTLQSSTTNENGQTLLRVNHVALLFIKYLLWAVLFEWIYGLFKRFDELKKSHLPYIAPVLINLLLLAFLHLILSNVIYSFYRFLFENIPISNSIEELLKIFSILVPSRLLDLIVILFILKITDTFRVSQNRKLKVVELQNQLHVSQLQSLRSQLNPHFLFNSLHALQTLIGHDDEKAKSMVIKISNLLRKILDQSDKQLITLEEELENLKDYLDIEEERFHDRLSIEFNIDENAKLKMVPSLLLQPLAENAFKHGISVIEGNGLISLNVELIDSDLSVEMANSTPLKKINQNDNSTNVGLTNLRSRLNKIYGEKYHLSFKEEKNSFKIMIKIKNI